VLAFSPLIALVTAAVAPSLLLPATDAAARTTLLAEGFEESTAGWRGAGADVRRVGGGSSGSHAALVASRAPSGSFSLRRATPPVTATLARERYRAGAWVRASRPGRLICLRLQELGPRAVVAGSRSCVRATRRWQRMRPVVHRARGPGHALVLVLGQVGGRARDSFEADSITLRADGRARPFRTRMPGASLPGERKTEKKKSEIQSRIRKT